MVSPHSGSASRLSFAPMTGAASIAAMAAIGVMNSNRPRRDPDRPSMVFKSGRSAAKVPHSTPMAAKTTKGARETDRMGRLIMVPLVAAARTCGTSVSDVDLIVRDPDQIGSGSQIGWIVPSGPAKSGQTARFDYRQDHDQQEQHNQTSGRMQQSRCAGVDQIDRDSHLARP